MQSWAVLPLGDSAGLGAWSATLPCFYASATQHTAVIQKFRDVGWEGHACFSLDPLALWIKVPALSGHL